MASWFGFCPNNDVDAGDDYDDDVDDNDDVDAGDDDDDDVDDNDDDQMDCRMEAANPDWDENACPGAL